MKGGKGAARKKAHKSAKNPNRPGWTGPGKLADRQAEEKRRDGHPPQNKEHHQSYPGVTGQKEGAAA